MSGFRLSMNVQERKTPEDTEKRGKYTGTFTENERREGEKEREIERELMIDKGIASGQTQRDRENKFSVQEINMVVHFFIVIQKLYFPLIPNAPSTRISCTSLTFLLIFPFFFFQLFPAHRMQTKIIINPRLTHREDASRRVSA